MNPQSSPARRGNLLLVMSVVVVVMGLSAAMVERSVSVLQQNQSREQNIRLWLAAESAANEAVVYARLNPTTLDPTKNTVAQAVTMTNIPTTVDKTPVSVSWYLSSTNPAGQLPNPPPPADLGGGATANYSMKGDYEQYLLRAVSRIGNLAYETDVWFEREPVYTITTTDTTVTTTTTTSFTATKALAADQSYSYMGSANTDSWNSANGTYATTAHGSMGDLASNGTVSVQKAGNVQGTAYNNAGIGMNFVYSEPGSFTSSLGDVATGQNVTLNAGGVYKASSIAAANLTLTGSGTVTIYLDGPYTNTNAINFGAGTKLVILQSNYASSRGDSTINGNTHVGVTTDPGRFFLATAYTGNVKLNGNASFGGVIYAPYATYSMNGTFDFFGSLTAKSFGGKVNGNFAFHFDEKLKNMKVADITTTAVTTSETVSQPVLTSWGTNNGMTKSWRATTKH